MIVNVVLNFADKAMKINVEQRAELAGKLSAMTAHLQDHERWNFVFNFLKDKGDAALAAKRAQKSAESNMKLRGKGVTAAAKQQSGKFQKNKKKHKGKGKGGVNATDAASDAPAIKTEPGQALPALPVASGADLASMNANAQTEIAQAILALTGFGKGKGGWKPWKPKGGGKGKAKAEANLKPNPHKPKGWDKDKDWICKEPSCLGYNFKSKTHCFHCGVPKPA